MVPLALADSAVNLQLRAWAPTESFWDVRWDLTAKRDIEAAGIGIPFPQRAVHVADAPTPTEPPSHLRRKETQHTT